MLTAERLRELMHYCPESGVFKRLKQTTRGPHNHVGTRHRTGYLYAMIDAKTYALHRLAWLYMTGKWPDNDIDHINGRSADNRFANLRDATTQTNMQNERRARKNNAYGLMGVQWRKDRQRFIAAIRVDGRLVRLGSFKTPQDAHAAYIEGKRRFHAGFVL